MNRRKNATETTIDLSQALVVSHEEAAKSEAKAVRVFIEEIEKRTGLSLEEANRYNPTNVDRPTIFIGTEESLEEIMEQRENFFSRMEAPGREGYRLKAGRSSEDKAPVIAVEGHDQRGVLYGVGKLLRKMTLTDKTVKVGDALEISSTPHNSLRGHQLGYRPKTNAYDAWDPEQFEQYIRELALFGANSIEIMPPRTDDKRTNSLMKVPPLEMMEKLSRIIDSYGLDVWVWYPNMGKDYANKQTVQEELEEREKIFSRLPRLDHIFIPGGDPGDLKADLLFKWTGEIAQLLEKHHPAADIWLSPQNFAPPANWLNSFYENVKEMPQWLGGIVFGPWVKTKLPRLREIVPDELPIRHYPDITHSYACQYPVPDWDLGFALTLGRESINPRPKSYKHIHNRQDKYVEGSLSYSEGINDDVNKFVFSDQDWDPGKPVLETLKEYARLFIEPELEGEIARGLLSLEDNFSGPLATNENVDVTFRQWREMEEQASDSVQNNYRFQMGLLRAHYDAYTKRRLIYERELEEEAKDHLREADSSSSSKALEEAKRALNKAVEEPVAEELKDRCHDLADDLFDNIGAQLSVEKHKAKSWNRGAFMDAIDIPLNDRKWLLARFDEIRGMDEEKERLQAIDSIVNRTDPGPGGIYENFRTVEGSSIQKNLDWKEDPGYLSSPLISFATPLLYAGEKYDMDIDAAPLAWINNASTHYDTPLDVRYEDLDPRCSYSIEVNYIGGSYITHDSPRIKLVANDDYVIHDYLEIKGESVIRQFHLPEEALNEKGVLKLTWSTSQTGSGIAIAELWIRSSDQ